MRSGIRWWGNGGVFAIGLNSFGVVAIGMNAVGSFAAIGLNAVAPISLGAINSIGLFSWAWVNAFVGWGTGAVNTIGNAHVGMVVSAAIVIAAVVILVMRWSPPPRLPRTPPLGAIGDDGDHLVRARVAVDGDELVLRDRTATLRARAADGVAIDDGDREYIVRISVTTAPRAGEHGYRDAIAERRLEVTQVADLPRGRFAIAPLEWLHGAGPAIVAVALIVAYLLGFD